MAGSLPSIVNSRRNAHSSLAIFSRVAWSRLVESRWTKLLPILALLQWAGIVWLEALIYRDNMTEYGVLLVYVNQYQNDTKLVHAVNSFDNRAAESFFFIMFVFLLFLFAVDAVIRQNSIQLFAYGAVNILCISFGIFQIYEAVKWFGNLDDIQKHYHDELNPTLPDIPAYHLGFQRLYACGVLAVNLVTTIFLIFLVWKLYVQFGWNVYKRIGADVRMQAMYRQYQIFLVCLKLTPLFQALFHAFYIGILIENDFGNPPPATSIYHIIITVLIPLSFLFIGSAARREIRWAMIAYVLLNLSVIINFGLILSDFSSSATWIFLIACGVIDSLLNVAYALIVANNFGKGLKDTIRLLGEEDSDRFGISHRVSIDGGTAEHQEQLRAALADHEEKYEVPDSEDDYDAAWAIDVNQGNNTASNVPQSLDAGLGPPPLPPPHRVPIRTFTDGSEKYKTSDAWNG